MKSKKLFKSLSLAILFIVACLLALLASAGCPPRRSNDGGSSCKTCVGEQMKYDCPKCVPLLRCMARCLWSRRSHSNCTAMCGCDVAKPSLSECRRCISRCKCVCTA